MFQCTASIFLTCYGSGLLPVGGLRGGDQNGHGTACLCPVPDTSALPECSPASAQGTISYPSEKNVFRWFSNCITFCMMFVGWLPHLSLTGWGPQPRREEALYSLPSSCSIRIGLQVRPVLVKLANGYKCLQIL